MGDESISFVVLWSGSLVRNDDGIWEGRNCKSKVASVGKKCTKLELEDEIYDGLQLDRNACIIRMKYFFDWCAYMEPEEIQRDRDVRCFLSSVRDPTKRPPPLYIEVIPRVSQFPRGNPTYERTFSSGNQFSSCPSPVCFGPIKTEVPGNQHEEDLFCETIGRDVGDDNVPVFPKQKEEEDYDEQLYDTNNDGNYNAEHDHIGFELGDVGDDDDDVDDDDELDDNHNVMHGPSSVVHEAPYEVPSSTVGCSSSQMTTSSLHKRRAKDTVDPRFVGCDSIVVGQIFNNKLDLIKKLSVYCMKENKEFKVKRSSTDQYAVVCLGDTCTWHLSARKCRDSDIFVVKKFKADHTCTFDVVHHKHRQATSKVIGECIKSKFQGIARVYKPKEIQFDVNEQFAVKVSYAKAWRAREYALSSVRGTFEEGYSMLPLYCHQLECSNPGTITHIKTDDRNCFVSFFMAIGASIRGFKSHIRPVLAVDGTTLKGKYKGTLYIAAGLDGNEQIYPLAFGIGDGENDEAYTWFFEKLKDVVGDVQNLVFVTDRHKAIESSLNTVFPNALHGFCMYHISNNIRANGFGNDVLLKCYFLAAKAYVVEHFDYYMQKIEKISMEAADYIRNCDPTKWARSHFPGKRYSIMTTNIAECMNAILKDGRQMPLLPLIDHIRERLQKWFFERREFGAKLDKPVTNWMEEQMGLRHLESLGLAVKPINMDEYEVEGRNLKGVVNLQAKTCSCKVFDLDQYPCDHCLAACRARNISPYSMCSRYYTSDTYRATYSESIYPVLDRQLWDAPDEVRNRIVLPPTNGRRHAGRPRTQRIPSQGEEVRGRRCSICHSIGHNRQSCRERVYYDPGQSSMPDISM